MQIPFLILFQYKQINFEYKIQMNSHNLLKKREEFAVKIRQTHVKKYVKQRRCQLVNQLTKKQLAVASSNSARTIREIKYEEMSAISKFFNQIKLMNHNILHQEQIYSKIIKIIKQMIQPHEVYQRKILDDLFEFIFHVDEIRSNYKNTYSLLNILNLNYLNNNQINLLRKIVDISHQYVTEEFISFLLILLNYRNHPLFQIYITEYNIQSLINVLITSDVYITELLLLFFVNLTYLNDEYIHVIVRYDILSKFLFTLEFGIEKEQIYTLTLMFNILTVNELSEEIRQHDIFNQLIKKLDNLISYPCEIQQYLCNCFIQYAITTKTIQNFKYFDQNHCFSHLIKILTHQFLSKQLKESDMHAIYHIIMQSTQENRNEIKLNRYFIALEAENGMEILQKLYNQDQKYFEIAEMILKLFTDEQNQ